jgi:hypothetical protein
MEPGSALERLPALPIHPEVIHSAGRTLSVSAAYTPNKVPFASAYLLLESCVSWSQLSALLPTSHRFAST